MGLLYCITNRIDGKIYIGITSATAEKRFRTHLKNARLGTARRKGGYLYNAMRKHGADNFFVETLHSYPTWSDAEQAEIDTIDYLKAYGYSLYNILPGGGISPMTVPEIRAKSSAKQRGRKFIMTPKRLAACIARRGVPMSEETKAKLSKINKNKKWSETHLKNVRAARAREIGRKLPPEWVEAAAAGHRGLKRSEDAKRRTAEKHRGMKRSEEARANIRRAVQASYERRRQEKLLTEALFVYS